MRQELLHPTSAPPIRSTHHRGSSSSSSSSNSRAVGWNVLLIAGVSLFLFLLNIQHLNLETKYKPPSPSTVEEHYAVAVNTTSTTITAAVAAANTKENNNGIVQQSPSTLLPPSSPPIRPAQQQQQQPPLPQRIVTETNVTTSPSSPSSPSPSIIPTNNNNNNTNTNITAKEQFIAAAANTSNTTAVRPISLPPPQSLPSPLLQHDSLQPPPPSPQTQVLETNVTVTTAIKRNTTTANNSTTSNINTTSSSSSSSSSTTTNNNTIINNNKIDINNNKNNNNKTTPVIWNCLKIKDAERYIDEWADYHFALGFTFLRIFDNSPNFSMKDYNWTGKDNNNNDKDDDRLFKKDKQVKVTQLLDVPGKIGTQEKAYKQCIEEALAAEEHVDWVGIIDVDEFLVPFKHDTIGELMEDHCQPSKQCGQLSFNWRMFGSANQTKYHPIPVLRRFQYMAPDLQSSSIKVLVDPRAVDLENFRWSHSVPLKKGYQWLDTSGNVIRNKGWRIMINEKNPGDVAVIYHYRFKSQEEYDFNNCVRGSEHQKKANKRCNTTAEVGTVFDDRAWQKLRKMVPKYKEFDEIGELE